MSTAEQQIDLLANFIMQEVSGEPGAVETAIRIISEQQRIIELVRWNAPGKFRFFCRTCYSEAFCYTWQAALEQLATHQGHAITLEPEHPYLSRGRA